MVPISCDHGNNSDDLFTDQSIPLQELSQSLDESASESHGRNHVGSRGLGRGRALLSRSSLRRPPVTGYETVSRSSFRGPPSVTDTDRASQNDLETGNLSPAEDPVLFAEATLSIGLNFGSSSPHHTISDSRDDPTFDVDLVNLDRYSTHEAGAELGLTETYEDTTPLADQRYVQAISGAFSSNGPLDGQNSDATWKRYTTSRLGDDLPNLERGLSERHRSGSNVVDRARSLSPSSTSAIQHASSIVKSMSQRVVNLSNAPGVIEESTHKETLQRDSRMTEPPSLPAIPSYAHDVPSYTLAGAGRSGTKRLSDKTWRIRNNPLKGRALGILGANNPLRVWLCDLLVHPLTEPFILLVIILQTVLLSVESSKSVWGSQKMYWGSASVDYVYLGIFIVYTLELTAKILVSGFILNPTEYSTSNRSLGLRRALAERGKSLVALQRQPSRRVPTGLEEPQVSIIRTFTDLNQLELESASDPLQARRVRLAHRAFLRHSFNRLDFLAVISFWVSFFLSLSGVEIRRQIYIFRMLSCLRILRLLAVTNGTTAILRSLKKAAPLLTHVAFLIGFFWLLFAIVGIQSFKSSLRRTCVWIDPAGQSNFTMNDPYNVLQFCGGYLDQATGEEMSWIRSDGTPSKYSPKGYICPPGSLCIEGTNPYNGTVNFDNIMHSLELVFVIMSANTFTDILYYTTDTDYLAAALFFAIGIVILALWMVNLLVAVITHSFQVIREESKRSAFAVQNIDAVDQKNLSPVKNSALKRFYEKTGRFWICVICFGLIAQAMRSSSMGKGRANFVDGAEIAVTLILLHEIILRFAADWRSFCREQRNWIDLSLAVITCIILLPPIRSTSALYFALTIFQILRIYRVILAFSVTRNLIMIVFRNAVGLLNLILFVFLITFLAAIFATQLFRGQIPPEDTSGNTIRITFADIYNSFLGMYQILSSENWTTILYNATAYTRPFRTAWISAIFLTLWFIVANFIVLNMFIAVIQESFDVSEDEKRLYQVRSFLEQRHVSSSSQGNLSLSKIFMLGRNSERYKDPLDHGPAALDMLLKDVVVREFLDDQAPPQEGKRKESVPLEMSTDGSAEPGLLARLWSRLSTAIMHREPNPFYSKLKFSRAYDDLDPKTMAKEVVFATERRKQAQREYLMKHPNYNKSLFVFTPENRLRKLCQRVVGPGRGHQRVEGVDPHKLVWHAFSAFIYAAIVAMVLLACITTPIYQRAYLRQDQSWYVYTDLGFAVLFTIEAIIKVIADGLFWTPNACFRGSWGFIDGIVLVTLWINVISALSQDRGVSRVIGAFKALRALRLLNVSDSAKDTFHSVIIVGGWKIISAAVISVSFLIPFAIYGVSLFNGKMVECNDSNVTGNLTYCVDEYLSSPYNWDVLAPRVASNPYYDFDNFGHSLFILFQIVSQEGWIDVQDSAMKITGLDTQPEPNFAPANGLFFVAFNLLGSVFVLTLFVSVFMRNYTEQTGVAFLTAEQRSWLELRKYLRHLSPSKKSINGKGKKWKMRCHRIAVKKHGRWAKCVTAILLFHLLLLVLEFYPEPTTWALVRDSFFFTFTLFYVANVIIRVVGLGWHRFSHSSWDLYSLLVVPGSFTTSVLNFVSDRQAIVELNKLFLVAITLLLIPRNNQLDQLFKTAAASLTAIGNLLATWFVLFIAYAIAMNQTFGLTKFGELENNNLNFRDIPRSLIFLFRTSVGEGWNQLMEDFATMQPPFCTFNDQFFEDDCGSASWARALFISWNIISMYIFVSLFVSLIFESFSYVYQRSSGLYVINREEIRRFKQAWSMFDPDSTGFISKDQFPRLLGELSGVFEMRIYDGEFSIGSILEQCKTDGPSNGSSAGPSAQVFEGVNLEKLSTIVQRIPVKSIRERRARLNSFYEEVLVTADALRGISFHSLLMILAHYNVISDSKSLRLEEFLRRRARMQRVEEAVRRNTVIGFFDMLYWSRKLRMRIEARRSARMATVPQFSVPEIFVNDQYQSSEDGVVTPQETGGASSVGSSSMLSPTARRHGNSSAPAGWDSSPGTGTDNLAGGHPTVEWSNISPSLTPTRIRAQTLSTYGATSEQDDPGEGGMHSRHGSVMSVQDMMDSIDNSAWGESLRRSFSKHQSNEQ